MLSSLDITPTKHTAWKQSYVLLQVPQITATDLGIYSLKMLYINVWSKTVLPLQEVVYYF